jgi:hypothetical protein
MLDAGRSILLEDGIGTSADTLTFKHAFERVEASTGVRLTNASVIRRVWRDRIDYQTDVFAAIAVDETRAEINAVVEAIAEILTGRDLSSENARAHALRDVCRVGAEAHADALRHSPGWSLWIHLWAMAVSDGHRNQKEKLHSALMEGYEGLNRQFEEVFGFLMPLLRVHPREPLTVRQFANAVGALAEGCSLRDRVDREMRGVVRPTGPNGEEEEWTVYGLALEALAHEFFESD